LIWSQLESQEKLLRLSVEEIDHLIEQSIAKSWLSLIDSDKIGLRIKAVETQRSKKLICQWLELEKQRAPFRVKYHEKSIAFTVANLPLTIRYDRMDELIDDGGLVVLDYKTGSVNIRSWAGIRPDDPQVPLYCLSLADKPIAAAVLAQLNVSEVTAKGISANAEIIPGLKTPEELTQLDLPNEWSEIQTFWRYNLEQLAHAFLQGDAQVDPKSVVGTCSYCDLKSLCRIGINDTGAE
jgi:ATP-dependent helicase/DNAse subunit B